MVGLQNKSYIVATYVQLSHFASSNLHLQQRIPINMGLIRA
jgi:hypothetical protein